MINLSNHVCFFKMIGRRVREGVLEKRKDAMSLEGKRTLIKIITFQKKTKRKRSGVYYLPVAARIFV